MDLCTLHKIEFPYEEIIKKSVENGLRYMDLNIIGEERKYFTKCVAKVDYERLHTIIEKLHGEVRKIVEHLSTRREDMLQLLDPEIVDVILKKPGEYSRLQRYDVIIGQDGEPNIVEVNSETPAGTPETVNTYLFDDYVNYPNGPFVEGYNVNEGFEINLMHNFAMIEKPGNIAVVFYDESEQDENKIGEDVTNAWYLSSMIQNSRESFVVNAEHIEMKDDGLYAYDKKIDNIQTFYPMEWYFLDEGGKQFWELYLQDKFDIVNGPINLISQSKAFWAWVFEHLDELYNSGVITDKNIFTAYVPRYYFTNQPQCIPKARLFREGVGIGEETKNCVFQQYIEQKKFECETFEGTKEGYLTLGVYCDQERPIGMYTRFCEKKVTDYTSYFIPSYRIRVA